ncbi:S1 RNA-binding domain-containing protein [Leptolyngbya sp. FACHB-16]|uniref:S1 RNA-binding domain-containing protein n=1 Tax=unclassified Leptolyngbya TaxID=2650499 RepID=UPI00168789C4|nr:S1 RNA-binding domain-containing protein [Leptolyngbya sp. FACHB-16]MBD2154175.1 S1 RNA-binding domain-containing protein [Leptolyngbya sp. FACHB-16]
MSFELGSFPLNEIVTGRIIKLEPKGVLVDFGTEQLAYIPQTELSLANVQSPEEAVQLNQVREFLVVGDYNWQHDCFFPGCTPETLNDDDRLYEVAQYRASLGREYGLSREDLLVHTKILAVQPDGVHVRIQWFVCSERPPTVTFSIRRLEIQRAWERMRQLQSEDVTLYPKVLKKRAYSAIVEIEGLQGFIDHSLDRYREELVIGEKLPLKILEAKEEFNRLRLIQLSTLIKLRQLQVGQVASGKVRSVKPYGVFIEIDGLSAFLHNSKIIPAVDHPNQVFKVGAPVKLVISEINLEKARVYLESCARSA